MSVNRVDRWRVLYPDERAALRSAIGVWMFELGMADQYRGTAQLLITLLKQLEKVEEGPRKKVVELTLEEM